MKNGQVRILLVMPKVDIGYQDWAIPPVGITYVSAALKKAGVCVYALNMNLETASLYDVLKQNIEEHSINMVATGGLVVNYHVIKEIMDTVKAINPEIVTYVGGSLVTFSAEAVMRGIQSADFGMLGEGEITACELVQAIEEGADLEKIKCIPGLIVRMKTGELYLTPPRSEISNINEIPWPDYDAFGYFDMIRNFWNSDVTGIVSAPLTTSRSCPFRCTFCSKSGGEKYRQRSLDNIFAELDWLVQVYKVNRLFLNDELFANDSERIKEFCARIREYNVQWFVSLRVSRHITRELLQMMKESGCIQVLYGLESGDDTVLRSMRKGITVSEIERVVRVTAEVGFQVRGNFIFGDPAETLETVNNTLAFVEKNKDVFASVALSPIILFPGSELYKKALKDGTIEDELEFIEKECPLRNVSGMSDDDYVKMLNEILPRAKMKLNAAKENRGVKNFTPQKRENKYSFEYSCPTCGHKNTFWISTLDAIMRTNQYNCEQCGQNFDLNVTHMFVQAFTKKMKKICSEHRVALWGCGQNLAVVDDYFKNFAELNYTLIDTDVMKIGKDIGGHIINSPEIIKERQIEFIVDMTSVRHTEIMNRIHREFPEVKYAYSMFDIPLLQDNDVMK